MAALTLRGITRRFGATTVLDQVSLDVESGEFVALLGSSGCGKSTLLRIIAGLDAPDEGRVEIGGTVATDVAPARRDVAMVFQQYALYPHKTVAENIALPLEMRRLSAWQRLPVVGGWFATACDARQQIARDVQAAAASVGIERLLDRRPRQLSGGQQQRVALARAMVRRPRLLLMDEPLSNLDARLRTRMRAEITELHRKSRATIVYVTHDQTEAMTMADRIAVMVEGRIVQIGAPRTLYEQPNDLRVAEILGHPPINLLRGSAAAGLVEAGGLLFAVDRAIAGQVRIGFRPEAAIVTTLAPATSAAATVTVARIEELGAERLFHLRLRDGQTVTARLGAQAPGACGDRLQLSVPSHAILLFDEQGARLAHAAAEVPASGLPASALLASGLPASGLPASGLPASGLPASTVQPGHRHEYAS